MLASLFFRFLFYVLNYPSFVPQKLCTWNKKDIIGKQLIWRRFHKINLEQRKKHKEYYTGCLVYVISFDSLPNVQFSRSFHNLLEKIEREIIFYPKSSVLILN